MSSEDVWREAQRWESQWWEIEASSCTNTFYEEEKQHDVCAPRMGIVFDPWGRIDLHGKNILDVGGGPVSMLLKCVNAGRRKIVDPLEQPAWIIGRYDAVGIEFETGTGEEMEESGWDEVWLYNVLQHVKDPDLVLRKCLSAGRVLRLFEWIDTEITDGHIHALTTDFFRSVLGNVGESKIVDIGRGWSCNSFSAIVHGDAPVRKPHRRGDGMRFHIPAVPHTVTNEIFVSCAFSQKVKKLCSMLTDLGHEVFHYGCEGSDVRCTEDVNVVSDEYRRSFYAGNEDMTKQFTYDTMDEYHQVFHRRCVEEIGKRDGGGDFLLSAWGWGHKPISDQFPGMLVVESGIGYSDTYAKYRVFESYAWMHWVYGKEASTSGRFYDVVIPNYFDPNDFTFGEDREDWFLYIGRLVKNKGIGLAVDVTRKIGAKLVIAGQGSLKNESEGLDIKGDHIEFVGHADVEKRRDLMSRARATFVPTYYIEPFGGVAVESMMSGSPVIATDYGAFSETVQHGVTGYRCHTMEQFEWAARNIENISPADCRRWAIENYSMGRVSLMYQEYFDMLMDLREDGWYQANPGRTEMDWLKKM
jgi:hypothetical protein